MIELIQASECTGCQACYCICPRSAINMKMNREGFFSPEIDLERCIHCHKCEDVCPEKKVSSPMLHSRLYATVNKSLETRLNSSSGGIFTALAENIINLGGVVFGAKFSDDFSIVHDWAENKNELYKFQQSKYVQSCMGDSFKLCKEFVEKDRWVLFSGTPCQIGALLSFLGKPYDKLITVDLICSGNTSPYVWKQYLSYLENKYKSVITKINFRDKRYGWDLYSLSVGFASGKEYCRIFPNDSWARLFLNHQSLRESCYQCKYKTVTHISDFTLGDFWGVQFSYPDLYDDKGLSFVLLHTKKAEAFYKNVSNLKSTELPIDTVVKHNTTIIKSAGRPVNREIFYEALADKQFKKVLDEFAHISVWKKSNIIYMAYWKLRGFGGGVYRNIRSKVQKH